MLNALANLTTFGCFKRQYSEVIRENLEAVVKLVGAKVDGSFVYPALRVLLNVGIAEGCDEFAAAFVELNGWKRLSEVAGMQ